MWTTPVSSRPVWMRGFAPAVNRVRVKLSLGRLRLVMAQFRNPRSDYRCPIFSAV
jgi:hypothetical protein